MWKRRRRLLRPNKTYSSYSCVISRPPRRLPRPPNQRLPRSSRTKPPSEETRKRRARSNTKERSSINRPGLILCLCERNKQTNMCAKDTNKPICVNETSKSICVKETNKSIYWWKKQTNQYMCERNKQTNMCVNVSIDLASFGFPVDFHQRIVHFLHFVVSLDGRDRLHMGEALWENDVLVFHDSHRVSEATNDSLSFRRTE